MLKYLVIPACLAVAPLCFAQLDSNSITVTSTRSTSLQPDQVVFAVFVDTPLTATMSDVLAALAGSVITPANFAGVGPAFSTFTTSNPFPAPGLQQPMLEWTFGLPTPIAKLQDTTVSLRAIQDTMAKNTAFTLRFNIEGASVSQQAMQAVTCSVSDLLSDARVQAQKLANAGGLSLGVVLAMLSSTNMPTPGAGSLGGVSLGGFLTPASSASACTLTVKFSVTRF